MSDLVVNVRQVSSYALGTPPVLPTDAVLLQRGGLGGPYISASAQVLVQTALSNSSLGVGFSVPFNADPGHVFGSVLALSLAGSLTWNAYYAAATGWVNWGSGPAALISFTGQAWSFDIGTANGVGQPITFGSVLNLSLAGAMSLPLGTLTVARDPSAALEVATMGYVGSHTVASFNGRNGVVQLTSPDVYTALALNSPLATQQWVCDQLNAAFQAFLAGTVVRWNNRSGNVFLMLSDITCVFFQPGQVPITQTPPLTSDDYSIANTAWVVQYVADTLGGGTGGLGLATEAWVLANTVNSFNNRTGPVTLSLADITNAGGAPLNSPALSGVPTAPTQPTGNAGAAIATTAFVWNAVQESTTGVVSWNARTGVVTLEAQDIYDAGGALQASPAFTGVPTAPTAPLSTATTQIATTAFVMNEVAATTAGVSSFNTRTGAVTLSLADVTGAGGAPIASPAFSGTPTVPSPLNPLQGNAEIANTQWVVQYVSLQAVASFNGRTGAVTLTANDVTAVGGLANPSPALSGVPTAPTAVPGTSSTQLATTAFVQAAIAGISGVTVSTSPPPSPYLGQAWFNNTASVQQLYVYTGAAFVPSSNLTGYMPLAGGVLTGPMQGTDVNLAGTIRFNVNDALNYVANGPAGAITWQASGGIGLALFAAPVGTAGAAVAFQQALSLTNAAVTCLLPLGVNGALQVNNNINLTGSVFSAAGNVALAASGTTQGVLFTQTSAGVLNIWSIQGSSLNTVNVVASTINLSGSVVPWNVIPVQNNVFNCGIAGTAWANVYSYYFGNESDERLKTDIQDLPDCLPIMQAIVPKRFRWLAGNDPETHWGFMAQDVERAMAGQPFGGHRISEEGHHSISYNELTAVLWKACQELIARVTALEARSAA